MSSTLSSKANARRRDLLKLGLGAAITAPVLGLAGQTSANTQATRAHIVISGAGAAGLAMANRFSRSLPNARITLIDAREEHHYQPGWTLVASGVWDKAKTLSKTAEWIPSRVNWVRGMVTEYDPDHNKVVVSNGDTLEYDYLIVACGLQLRFERVEGMDPKLIGQGKGVGSVYASIDAAASTYDEISRWIAKGSGSGLFNLPPSALKCAGAPLKMTFTTLSRLEDSGKRNNFNVEFMTPSGSLFSVPFYHEFVKQRFIDQGVTQRDFWTLKGIDAEAKKAYYSVRDGEDQVKEYEFIHVVPPMTAPDAILNSPLRFADDSPFKDWMAVDRETLQNPNYPNVWGIGDVMGMPINKTAASVKMQAGVLERNVLAHMQGQPLPAKHNGYTSCPLITGIGKAMLVEFGWDAQLLPSFSFIDPKEESWTVWVMKERMLRPAYFAMLEGKI